MFGLKKKPVQNIATLLTFTMTQELESAMNMLDNNKSNIMQEYDRLKSLGLENTQNAKELKKNILPVSIEKLKQFIDLIREMRSHFGDKTILISHKAFKDICERYKLEIDLLNKYTGVIPKENILDLVNAKEKINSFIYQDCLNKGITNHQLLVVHRYKIHRGDEPFRSFLKENNYMLEIKFPLSVYKPIDIIGAVKDLDYTYNTLTDIYGTLLTKDDFLIACPEKYLNNSNIKISKKAVDPIVFQHTPYGILIYTVWGEEAEDSVLKRYLEFNRKADI